MKYLQDFFKNEIISGIILIIATITAILLANLDFTRDFYYNFLQIPIELRVGKLKIDGNMLLWINDALMTIFFLLVSIEIKRELIQGNLTNYRQIAFPVVAAIGGMIMPALIYLAFNFLDHVARNGWAIPIATDIAFVIGILEFFSGRIPKTLKFFLMSLAIIDDLGAIIVIALFYTKKFSLMSFYILMLITTILAFLNFYNIRYIGIYVLIGVILWIAVLKTGIHSTLAGVIIGFFIPLKEQKGESPAKKLESILYPWVVFLILPLFAFSNAGFSLQNITTDGLVLTIPIGIIIGLFIGKPLGILFFCWSATKLKLAILPQGATWLQVISISMLCGIGFTMSIFISTLAFEMTTENLIIWAKLGILIGSLLSACIGCSMLQTNLLSKN